ncbi:uncharacterized protein A1O9_11002 [Exophiala aquamarina CBS 119918]|uniref:Xylanolytic transcriptional activator regulatory domain-containing protein n=1 Tax=Exophiala aquamarina CBS 119918 TaxID=1182545 RepID=A0A072NYY1_9EURO|nr:uncharacterized protein A1O9_11002 [Exophiala aquamarina CBS 119918]KEF53094.1 hypothetical protein A1O9_11002 [Exophiala aquamarina CBS 119918]
MSRQGWKNPLPSSQSDSIRLSTYWAGCALDIMKYHHNKPCDMFEDIQATILLGFFLLNVEGFSARLHSYLIVIVSRVRDLSLHNVDTKGSSKPRGPLDTEIKRRVWWHIVTTDWILSLPVGAQEGTYSVQPRQMAVNVPSNIDDEDLNHTYPPINRPLSEPTAISNFFTAH